MARRLALTFSIGQPIRFAPTMKLDDKHDSQRDRYIATASPAVVGSQANALIGEVSGAAWVALLATTCELPAQFGQVAFSPTTALIN